MWCPGCDAWPRDGAAIFTQGDPADAVYAVVAGDGRVRIGAMDQHSKALMVEIFRDGQRRYGERAKSDDIIRRLEEATGLSILAPGFPAEMVDDEPEAAGYEVVPPAAMHG